MFKIFFRNNNQGKIRVKIPMSRKQRVEVKVLQPEWKRFIEL